jgi:hypothetical protein
LPKKFKNSPKKFSFDSFDKNIIHEKINKFHKKKIFPTIRDIFNEIKENENSSFEGCSDETFRKLFKKMGFKFVKTEDIARKIVIMT